MNKIRMGLAMCGSYCTYEGAMNAVRRLCTEYDVTPIMSENSSKTDTRFGKSEDFLRELTELTGRTVVTSIKDAEPIGPKKLLDVLVIAPCTGNTLAKMANGITDTSVTMAAKAHLRNGGPVVLAIATNDALSANGKNIGELMARKNVYIVPFYQDDPFGKPCSVVSDFDRIERTVEEAMAGRQLQPLLLQK